MAASSSVDSTAVAQTPSFRVSERQLQRRRQSNLSPDTPVLPVLARVRSLRALLTIVVLCVAAVVVALSVYLLYVVGRVDNGIGYEDGGWHLTALLSNSTALTTMTTAARTAAASVELRPIRIGEDCSSPLTKCVYFNPRLFLAERQSMRNRSEDEDEDEDERGPRRRRRRIEHDVCYVNLIKYMYLRCHPRDVHHCFRSRRRGDNAARRRGNETRSAKVYDGFEEYDYEGGGFEDDDDEEDNDDGDDESGEEGTLRCRPRTRVGRRGRGRGRGGRDRSSGLLDMPSEVTFYGVYKTGGTSLFAAVSALRMNQTHGNNLDPDALSKARDHSEHIERMQRQSQRRQKTKNERIQSRWEFNDKSNADQGRNLLGGVGVGVCDGVGVGGGVSAGHTAIAIIRDPVERFVSAASQVLSFNRLPFCQMRYKKVSVGKNATNGNTTTNTANATHTTTKTEMTKLDKLRCVLEMAMRNRTSYRLGMRDPHLESQHAYLSCNTNGGDVTFSLYRQEDLTELLGQLGLTDDYDTETSMSTYTSNTTSDRNSKSTKMIISTRMNVGSDKKFSFKVSDMNQRLINDVCEFYSIDVDMFTWLGFNVPLCRTRTRTHPRQ